MAGTKRHFEHPSDAPSTSGNSPTSSPFMPMFETFRNELDQHHDRRERIIKASRDLTALSKKIIFSLQRNPPARAFSVRQLQAPLPASVTKENDSRLSAIGDLFASVANDLQDINAWRYQRQISGGVQEYMEAVSFQCYLEAQRLITYEEAQAKIPGGIVLTEDDYVLGLFDLVGELMRFAITTMATNGTLPRGATTRDDDDVAAGRDILTDLRALRAQFEGLDTSSGDGAGMSPLKREAGKKTEVMRTCVEKVERAVYGMIIRGRERPKGWVPDLGAEERGREPVESY